MSEASARAQDALYRSPYSLRETGAVGMMLSSTQIKQYHYERAIVLAGVQAARRLWPWLELHVGLQAGGFFSAKKDNPTAHDTGGMLDVTGGVLLRVEKRGLSPYATVDVGPAWTGSDLRPYISAAIGFDAPLTGRYRIGPVAGYSQLFQWQGPAYSTDARFMWLGLSLRQQLGKRSEPPKPPPPPPRVVKLEVPPPAPPQEDVLELIERALPVSTQRVEMLAPVLFDYDSDALQANGVAMLHEVRQTLEAHPELAHVQIEGYADQRGDAEYNRALSQRRAERVHAWLLEHGIAPERLEVVARGANAFVEPGTDEVSREQNRRVIFRIVDEEPAP